MMYPIITHFKKSINSLFFHVDELANGKFQIEYYARNNDQWINCNFLIWLTTFSCDKSYSRVVLDFACSSAKIEKITGVVDITWIPNIDWIANKTRIKLASYTIPKSLIIIRWPSQMYLTCVSKKTIQLGFVIDKIQFQYFRLSTNQKKNHFMFQFFWIDWLFEDNTRGEIRGIFSLGINKTLWMISYILFAFAFRRI